jgi:hypothetical protein
MVDLKKEDLPPEVPVAIDMSRPERSIVAMALQEVAVDLYLSVHEILPNRNVVIVHLYHAVQEDVVGLNLVVQEIHLDQPNEAIVDLHHVVQGVSDLCLVVQEIFLDQNAVAVNPLHRIVQDLAVDRDLAVIQVGGSNRIIL